MKPYNQRLQIRNIVERWDNSYRSLYIEMPDKLKILQKLELLDTDKCVAEDIDKIIGNKSWTHFMCMSCESYKYRGVVLNDDYVCLDCIKDAIDLFKNDAPVSDGVQKGDEQ